MRKLTAVVLLLLISALGATAQPAQPTEPPAVAPGPEAPVISAPAPAPAPALPNRSMVPGEIAPVRTMMLDVRALDIDHLLRLIGEAAGLTVVKDPAVTGPVTIVCPKPVSIDEALEILNAVLQVRGFTAVRQGPVLKITTLNRAMAMTLETHVGTDPTKIPPGDRIITQIVPLTTLDAGQLAAELTPLSAMEGSPMANTGTNTLYITDTAYNVQRLLGIINEMEKRNAAGIKVFRLRYVAAEDMADLIYGLLQGGQPTTTGAPYEQRLLPRRTTAGPQPTGPRPAFAAAGAGAGGPQILTDARTNSLIVMAGPERAALIEKFVTEFDKPVDYASTITVIAVQHARADEIAAQLNNAFGGATTQPSTLQNLTGGTSQTNPFGATGTSYQNPVRNLGSNAPAQSGTVRAQAASQSQQTSQQLTMGRDAEGHIVPLVEGTGIVVFPIPGTNKLIVSGSPDKLELVRQMAKELDVEPTQVLIQAIIAEITLDKQNELGLQYSFLRDNLFGHSGVSSSLGQNFGIQQNDSSGNPIPLQGLAWSVLRTKDFSALLHAISTDSSSRILSDPSIFTTSGKEAQINVSTIVPYATGQITSTVGAAVSTTFSQVSVGIVLDVIPYVGADGTVTMDVSQTANDLLSFQQVAPGVNAPLIAQRLAQASPIVHDGETVVLGGLMRETTTITNTGIPLLKDLPLLGWIFRDKKREKQKSELLVFLTPHVVRSREEARQLTEELKGKHNSLPRIPTPPPGPEG